MRTAIAGPDPVLLRRVIDFHHDLAAQARTIRTAGELLRHIPLPVDAEQLERSAEDALRTLASDPRLQACWPPVDPMSVSHDRREALLRASGVFSAAGFLGLSSVALATVVPIIAALTAVAAFVIAIIAGCEAAWTAACRPARARQEFAAGLLAATAEIGSSRRHEAT